MISPEVQRTAINDYAASRGYDVTGWFEGLDESGSRSRSAWWPRLDQAVAAIEVGEYDVLLVWKFSRAGRHRLRWAVAIDRVETAGGRLESATEQFDTTTSSGRLARGMLAELNAFEAERIGETWKEAHARRIATGRPANGKPRFGYAYDLAKKQHVPDQETGPVLAEMYRRYVSGESVYALVAWLNENGWTTTADRPWRSMGLRRVMDSGFASGRFLAAGQLHDGAHEALITEDLWQAYQDARIDRRSRHPRSERSDYLLSGLVRCAQCGGSMSAGSYGRARVPKYRCTTNKATGRQGCSGGHVASRVLEEGLLLWLHELANEVDARVNTGTDAALLAEARATAVLTDLERVRRELARATEALARFAVQNAEHPLPDSVYRAAHDELATKVADLSAREQRLGLESRRDRRMPGAIAAGLLERWELDRVVVRREALRGLVGSILVWTGLPRGRSMIVPAWEVR